MGLSRLLLIIDAENRQRYNLLSVCQTKQRDVSAEATPPLLNVQVVTS